MWACPNDRVVVCPVNTDQTDGTLVKTTETNIYTVKIAKILWNWSHNLIN